MSKTTRHKGVPRSPKLTHDEQLLSAVEPAAESFIHTDPWRVFRIMGEFVEGFESLTQLGPAVTIFGSARTKPDHPQYQKAVELAYNLGKAGFTIITGGGPGIMEAANRGAYEAGVNSVGLNIELPFEQGPNAWVNLPVHFHYFFIRKMMFVKYAQAFVIFPGGFGTMDELFESLTLIQTGKVRHFPVVLFDSAYWQGLFDWLRNTMLAEGKIAAADLDLVFITDSIADACQFIVEGGNQQQLREQQEEAARQITRRVWERS
ncbi:MAG: TIGR00730 family Rossman fold protein [Candidatus Promineifilaceae bacterium]